MVERYRQGQRDEQGSSEWGEDDHRFGGRQHGVQRPHSPYGDQGYYSGGHQGMSRERESRYGNYGGYGAQHNRQQYGERFDESQHSHPGFGPQGPSGEHDIPVYGSGRGPYANRAGYGAYMGVAYNYGGVQDHGVYGAEPEGFHRRHEGRREQGREWPFSARGNADEGRYGDHGAYGAQGYGGEGGTGAQGYGGQGAYGSYGSRGDMGTPGGYGGDRTFRQSQSGSNRQGGAAQYEREVSYGQGSYGGYGSGTMGHGESGRSVGNWDRSQRRGPKGYQRSDERLKEDICERLMSRWDIDSSEVGVQVQGGKVKLEGSVPERRMRYLIEDVIDGCHGVQDIENHVRVESNRSFTGGVSGEASSRPQSPSSFSEGGKIQERDATRSSQTVQSGGESRQQYQQSGDKSITAAHSGQSSDSGASLGRETRSSAPARSASTSDKKDT